MFEREGSLWVDVFGGVGGWKDGLLYVGVFVIEDNFW